MHLTDGIIIFRVSSGDYVLRDPAGGPRGTVRVMLKWKYPFQLPVDALRGGQERGVEEQGRAMRSKEERRREEDSPRPIAKPRVKVMPDQNIYLSLYVE